MTRTIEAIVEEQARRWQIFRAERRAEREARPVVTVSRQVRMQKGLHDMGTGQSNFRNNGDAFPDMVFHTKKIDCPPRYMMEKQFYYSHWCHFLFPVTS